MQFGGSAAHEFSQFVVYYLHHQLAGLYGRKHVHSESFLLHGVGKRLGYLVVHVGIEERTAHVLQRFGHIYLRYLAFAFQYFERPIESLA